MTENRKNNILKEHDLYKQYSETVKMYYEAYENENYINSSTLNKNRKEGEDVYERRTKRAIRYNLVKFITDLYLKAIFGNGNKIRRELKGKKGKEDLSKYESNFDLCGNSIDKFMKESAKNALIGKQGYILMNNFLINKELNLLEEQLLGIRPFGRNFDFLQLTNWSLDATNNYNWIVLKYTVLDNSNIDEQDKKITYYLFISKTEYGLYKKDSKKDADLETIKEDTNPIKEIPIVKVVLLDELRNKIGYSLTDSIYKPDKEIFNLMSGRQNLINQQCFNQLVINGNIEGDKKGVNVGENTVLKISGDPKYAPFYLAPDTKPFQEIREEIKTHLDFILMVSGFKGQNTTAESGISKYFDYINTNQTLESISIQLQQYELKAWYYFYLFLTGKNVKSYTIEEFTENYEIEYPDNFDLISLADQIETLSEALSLDISETANKEIKKKIVNLTLEDSTDNKTMDKIINEIDSEKEEKKETDIITEENENFKNNMSLDNVIEETESNIDSQKTKIINSLN